MMYEPTPEGQQKFYKTFMESHKIDNLSNSNANLFEVRPKSAKIELSEKRIEHPIREKIQTTSDKVNDLINCPICLDMIEDATETPCCNNIF